MWFIIFTNTMIDWVSDDWHVHCSNPANGSKRGSYLALSYRTLSQQPATMSISTLYGVRA
jgi:hypothetical protein